LRTPSRISDAEGTIEMGVDDSTDISKADEGVVWRLSGLRK
jgi:hypothetical protein